jgi:hypothetical protein
LASPPLVFTDYFFSGFTKTNKKEEKNTIENIERSKGEPNHQTQRVQPVTTSARLEQLARYQAQEQSLQGFPWSETNSHLSRGEKSFQRWFEHVLPEGEEDLKTYIEKTVASHEDPTFLELGGIGSNLV